MGELEEIKEIETEEKAPETSLTVVNPLTIIQHAVDANIDTDKLEKLMDLQERWEKSQAKKAFDEAMMRFQGECPIIKKTKEGGRTRSGEVAYMYAPLEDIVAQVKELLAKNGFSYIIKTEFEDDKIKAICIARHKQGHSEESVMIVPLMTKTGVMSDAQVVAATSTFAKRYAFCNAFGIMTMDDDTDSITEDLWDMFNKIIEEWDYKEHIVTVANSLTRRKPFEQFIKSLPNVEQLKLFKVLLQEIDISFHQKLWNDFQRQTSTSANEWLDKLKQSLNKK